MTTSAQSFSVAQDGPWRRALRPYTAYKDSGIEWLGGVPAHWRSLRLKRVVAEFVAGGTPDRSNLEYWADGYDGFAWVSITDMTRCRDVSETRQRITCRGLQAKRLRVLPIGTILYSMYASIGEVAVLGIAATTNQAILGLIPSPQVVPAFLVYWLESSSGSLKALASSNTQDNLNAEKVRNLPIFVPPLEEQQAIAAFLDRETAKTDALIAKQERLIALLREKRQALITHAVTKGLDPAAPMKDSGIAWLGEIPKHWKVMTLKRLASIRYGLGQPPKESDTGLPLIRATNISAGQILPEGMLHVDPRDVQESRNAVLHKGDIIVVRSGALTGDSAIVPPQYDGSIVGYDLVVSGVAGDSEFFGWIVLSSPVRDYQFALQKTRAAQPHLNAEELGDTVLCIPPIPEQAKIAEHLRRETNMLDSLIGKAREAIALLQEHRASLIAAAVTGKIDLRAAVRAEATA